MDLFKKNKAFFVLLIIYILYLGFALPSLHKPLVADDAAFAKEAENPQFGLLGVWHPPLYFDSLRVLVHHLGIERENLRIFGLFSFLLTLFLIYFLSKEIYQNVKVSILASFLFATHPWAIQGSLILDIDNTILTVLLTLFIFYFIKSYNSFSLKRYLFSGILFFLCLWAKLSTPWILLFSILAFYTLKGEIKKGINYVLSTGLIGAGLFLLFWLAYSQNYNLDFFSLFGRSLAVLSRGLSGSSLPASGEIVLRLIRVSLWLGIYFCFLWLIIFILRLKDYFTPLESPAIYGGDDKYKSLIPYRKGGVKAPSFLTGFTHKKGIDINDFLLIYTILIFVSYIFIGGTSFGFAKYQYPALPILSIIVANFILNLRLRITKRQLGFYILIGLIFFIAERFFINNLLYQINYVLRKIAIFSPQNLIYFFRDFAWRMSGYLFVVAFGVLFIWLISRKEKALGTTAMLILVLMIISNFSYNLRHIRADYFTTYCYGRAIKGYRQIEGLFRNIILKDKDAIIIGPEDVLFSAGLRNYPQYSYSYLWNDRKGFLEAIKDRRVKCISYSFTWNALFTYKEIFFHPEVKKVLEERYYPFSIGEYNIWLRR